MTNRGSNGYEAGSTPGGKVKLSDIIIDTDLDLGSYGLKTARAQILTSLHAENVTVDQALHADTVTVDTALTAENITADVKVTTTQLQANDIQTVDLHSTTGEIGTVQSDTVKLANLESSDHTTINVVDNIQLPHLKTIAIGAAGDTASTIYSADTVRIVNADATDELKLSIEPSLPQHNFIEMKKAGVQHCGVIGNCADGHISITQVTIDHDLEIPAGHLLVVGARNSLNASWTAMSNISISAYVNKASMPVKPFKSAHVRLWDTSQADIEKGAFSYIYSGSVPRQVCWQSEVCTLFNDADSVLNDNVDNDNDTPQITNEGNNDEGGGN